MKLSKSKSINEPDDDEITLQNQSQIQLEYFDVPSDDKEHSPQINTSLNEMQTNQLDNSIPTIQPRAMFESIDENQDENKSKLQFTSQKNTFTKLTKFNLMKNNWKRISSLKLKIKFGENYHPLLKYWIAILSITGAPVYCESISTTEHRIKQFVNMIPSSIFLAIYHILFYNSTTQMLTKLSTHKHLFDSIWYQVYPILFNLAVVAVCDFMWFIGLGYDCWLKCILTSLNEKPLRFNILTSIKYNYFGKKHIETKEKTSKSSKTYTKKSKLKKHSNLIVQIVKLIFYQSIPFGCCFTYIYTSYLLIEPVKWNIYFVLEIVNIIITCAAWLSILWIYMTFCQVLKWRFQHLNDYIWQFRTKRILPNNRQFHIFTSIYHHYLNTVSIIDNFFKYWIAAIFGVLFYQVTLYFHFVINSFEKFEPNFQLLGIPLITLPFLGALLILIKKAADVNVESRNSEEIIAKIVLHSREPIDDNFYKKVSLFTVLPCFLLHAFIS